MASQRVVGRVTDANGAALVGAEIVVTQIVISRVLLSQVVTVITEYGGTRNAVRSKVFILGNYLEGYFCGPRHNKIAKISL